MHNLTSMLIEFPEESILSDENEKILQSITDITVTHHFTQLNLSDEKLDELVASLKEQEIFSEKIIEISDSLNACASILMKDESEEELYL